MSLLEERLEPALRIGTRPGNIFIEKSTLGQVLHFDFIVENLTEQCWRIKVIELSVFDATGRLAMRKFVDESGSIQTIPNRELKDKTSAMVLNPFFLFDHALELHTLHYRYTFACAPEDEEEEEKQEVIEVTVSPVLYEAKTTLRLPLQERIIIWDGHDFYSHHRRFDYLHPMLQHFGFKTNFQRYGYDLVPVNEAGDMFQGRYENNEDWPGFGASVHATASGRVADLHDGMPDNRRFDEVEIATREMVVFGNYVIVDHQNGEYSCFAHLKQGSISVTVGQEVQQGQIIGQIGASGSSLFPHLHYELRNGIGVKDVDGLPSYFSQFRRILGAKSIDVPLGQIDTGDIVQQQFLADPDIE